MDIGFAGALVGGTLALLSPCSVMLLPAFFAYAFTNTSRLLAKTGIFYLGLIATLVPLGVFASTLGGLVTQNRYLLIYAAATIIIVIGILQIAGVNFNWIRLPARMTSGKVGASPASVGTTPATVGAVSTQQTRQPDGAQGSGLSVFFLGAVYAVAGVCAGPILGSVLTMAALGGHALYGGVLLALYGLGMVVPLFILSAIWMRMGKRGRNRLKPRTLKIGNWQNSYVMIISGVLAIGIGIFLIVTDGTESLGGFFSVDTQYAAESWVSTTISQIPNYWFVVASLMLLVLVAGLYWILRNPKQAEPEQKNFVQLDNER